MCVINDADKGRLTSSLGVHLLPIPGNPLRLCLRHNTTVLAPGYFTTASKVYPPAAITFTCYGSPYPWSDLSVTPSVVGTVSQTAPVLPVLCPVWVAHAHSALSYCGQGLDVCCTSLHSEHATIGTLTQQLAHHARSHGSCQSQPTRCFCTRV